MMTFKKISTALILTALMPLQAFASTFTDVDATNTNYLAIEYLVSTGTLQGYSDNTFKADQTINRAELMKILVAGQGIDPDANTYQNCFPDVTTDWYAKYVCYAHEQGWVDGYPDNTFKPAQTVNKVEAAKMIVNAYGFSPATEESQMTSSFMFTDVSATDWFYGYVMVLTDVGVIDRDDGSTYSPANDMSRGSVAKYIFRCLVANGNDEEIYTDQLRDEFLTTAGLGDLIAGAPYIVTVFYDGEVAQVESDEYVEIGNAGSSSIDLEAYYVMGSKGEEVYTFPSVRLAPGETIKVYTNQGEYSFESEDALWNNSEETAYLFDPNGNEVDSFGW